MSGNISLKFKKENDYKDFCDLFKDIPLEYDYITFKYDLGDETYGSVDDQRTVCYLSLKYHNYKRVISFEYPYSDCHNAFCFYLVLEISKKYKYKTLINWDFNKFMSSEEFFSKFKRRYYSSFISSFGGCKEEEDMGCFKAKNKDPFQKRLEMCTKIEDNLRSVICPGFFHSNMKGDCNEEGKFKQYIWK
jgi:hypothetical protein